MNREPGIDTSEREATACNISIAFVLVVLVGPWSPFESDKCFCPESNYSSAPRFFATKVK